jgi:CheY-like chemotaxis protein
MTTPEPSTQPIMVVNSEDAFLIAVKMLLEDEGYLVITASYREGDPFPGVVAVNPALVILDFVHGEPDGWELLARLDADGRTSAIPLIATSTDQELLDRVVQQPVSARLRTFLLKPLELEQLVNDVHQMLNPA